MLKAHLLPFVLSMTLSIFTPRLCAESGYEGWLRYVPLQESTRHRYHGYPETAVLFGDSPLLTSAREELSRGLLGMLGLKLKSSSQLVDDSVVVLGTWPALSYYFPELKDTESLA